MQSNKTAIMDQKPATPIKPSCVALLYALSAIQAICFNALQSKSAKTQFL